TPPQKSLFPRGGPRHHLCSYRYHVFHYHQRCPYPQLCCNVGLPRFQSTRGLRDRAWSASDSPNPKAPLDREVGRHLGAGPLGFKSETQRSRQTWFPIVTRKPPTPAVGLKFPSTLPFAGSAPEIPIAHGRVPKRAATA